MKKWLCFVLAMVMLFAFFGCKKKDEKTPAPNSSVASYIGTWIGNDHDGENVVHYLIFDENGYWNVYMNATTLARAIRQMSDRYVSFKVTFTGESPRNNSDHTGCFYEYVSNSDDATYSDVYSINEDGCLVAKDNAELSFEKYSTHTGTPNEEMENEARDLFDRAWNVAHSEE